MNRLFTCKWVQICILILFWAGCKPSPETSFPGEKDLWMGYERYTFTHAGKTSYVVVPKETAPGKPWVWRALFWGHEPQVDITLLSQGFHLVYNDVSDMYGSAAAVKQWNSFYKYLITRHGFSPKPVLEGMSRGGLIIYNWAIANPDKVSCIYADAPVIDFRSWPGGKMSAKGSPEDWEKCLKAYGLTEAKAMEYPSVADRLKPLADAGVPLLHVVGEADDVVPVAENTAIVEKNYQQLGGKIKILSKPGVGHHPHSLASPLPIVDFILQFTGMRYDPDKVDYFQLRGGLTNSRIRFEREKIGTVAFMGGSITWNPGWRDMVSEYLEARFPETEFTFINAGISSTGSTPGAFRLEQDVLSKGPIDLFFEEAAVNDATNGRTDTEQIRGMEGIVRHALAVNPEMDIVLMYFVDPEKMEDYRSGKIPAVVTNHEKVAEHYQITSLDLAREVTERIYAEEFTWEDDFKDLHPSPFGQEVYFQSLKRMLETAWADTLTAAITPVEREIPEKRLDDFSYDEGSLVSPEAATFDKNWKLAPSWQPSDGAETRRGFVQVPILVTDGPKANLRFSFSGRAVGIWVVAGPDAGKIAWRVDGGAEKTQDQFTQWSSFLHLPWVYMLETELTSGDHTLELRTLPDKNPESKGYACRIVYFVVNGGG
ncbi:MAG: GDSL-type esterase/lipase family protein [Bacteroidia bacterium]|nr:GDSL-type esterase/lipase family protein [Bacteroidia bacterium]